MLGLWCKGSLFFSIFKFFVLLPMLNIWPFGHWTILYFYSSRTLSFPLHFHGNSVCKLSQLALRNDVNQCPLFWIYSWFLCIRLLWNRRKFVAERLRTLDIFFSLNSYLQSEVEIDLLVESFSVLFIYTENMRVQGYISQNV